MTTTTGSLEHLTDEAIKALDVFLTMPDDLRRRVRLVVRTAIAVERERCAILAHDEGENWEGDANMPVALSFALVTCAIRDGEPEMERLGDDEPTDPDPTDLYTEDGGEA